MIMLVRSSFWNQLRDFRLLGEEQEFGEGV